MQPTLVGVQVARDGAVDLADGVVTGNPVGVNVQEPSYDISRVMTRVRYVDNGTNLDASELPTPDPTP